MRRYASIFVGLFILMAHKGIALQTSEPSSKSLPTAEPTITLDLQNATLMDVVRYLGQTYKIKIVTDLYTNPYRTPDVRPQRVSISPGPVKTVLAKLAERYGRDLIWLDQIAILRHKEWGWMLEREREYRMEPPGAKLSLQRLEEPETLPLPTMLVKQLPAKRLSLEASAVTLGDLEKRFSEIVGWSLQIELSLKSRRFNAWLENVTPGEVLEAITRLVNARQKVVIEQSDSQKKLDSEVGSWTTGGMRLFWSNVLKPELIRLLTPEQRAQYEQGEIVSLPLDSLPPDLQTFVIEYITMTYQRLQGTNQATLFDLDMSRLSEFTIDLLPPPNLAVGASGYLVNGRRILF